MENTVRGLKAEFSPALLKAILTKLEQKQQEHEYTEALYMWLQAVFKYKAADLVAERGTIGALVPIYKAIEDRTLHFDKLIMLKGKLDLLLQLSEREKGTSAGAEPKYEAVKVLDENAEEEIEGVEVIDIKEYKKTAELMAESELAAAAKEETKEAAPAEEELPEVVEMEDEEENKVEAHEEKEDSDSEKMDEEDADDGKKNKKGKRKSAK